MKVFSSVVLAALLVPAAGTLAQAVKPEVAAVVAGQTITLAEVDQAAGAALMQARQSEYDLRANVLKGLVFERLLTAEAAKQKMTVEALTKKEVLDRAVAAKPEEITATLQQYRAQLPPDEAQARQLVEEALKNRSVEVRREAYRKELVAASKVTIALQPPRFTVAAPAHSPARGPVTAPVTIVEFSDFQCPYCAQGRETVERVKATYGDKVRLVFRNLPLDMHTEARFAAQAGVCASEQGKFWEMHDWMFMNPRTLMREQVVNRAGEMSLNVEKFKACLDDSKTLTAVQEDLAAAEALGVRATPAFFVNGRLLPGAMPYERFVEVIDEELAMAAPSEKVIAR